MLIPSLPSLLSLLQCSHPRLASMKCETYAIFLDIVTRYVENITYVCKLKQVNTILQSKKTYGTFFFKKTFFVQINIFQW